MTDYLRVAPVKDWSLESLRKSFNNSFSLADIDDKIREELTEVVVKSTIELRRAKALTLLNELAACNGKKTAPTFHIEEMNNEVHGNQNFFTKQPDFNEMLPDSPGELVDLTYDTDDDNDEILLNDNSYSSTEYNERRTTKDVFTSDYPEELPEITNKENRWIVKNSQGVEVDLTTVFLKYRQQSLKENSKDYKCITPIRALSLDCIMLISIDDYISPYTHKNITLKLERRSGYNNIPNYALTWPKEILDAKENDETSEWDVLQTMIDYQSKAISKKDKFVLDFSRCLNDLTFTTFTPTNMQTNEDTLVHKSLHSPLNWVFGSDPNFLCHWANASLNYCKGMKSGSLQPDFTAFFNVCRRRFDIFVVEVKKPGCSEGSDLIKLGYMLRRMLTALVVEGVGSPMVFGMIVNGHQCSTYRMSIESAYVFKLVEMKKFRLPSQDCEIRFLDSVVESLHQIKTLALEMSDRIKQHFDNQKNGNASERPIPMEFLPPLLSDEDAECPSTSSSSPPPPPSPPVVAAANTVTTTTNEAVTTTERSRGGGRGQNKGKGRETTTSTTAPRVKREPKQKRESTRKKIKR